jgi:hypothetical protein
MLVPCLSRVAPGPSQKMRRKDVAQAALGGAKFLLLRGGRRWCRAHRCSGRCCLFRGSPTVKAITEDHVENGNNGRHAKQVECNSISISRIVSSHHPRRRTRSFQILQGHGGLLCMCSEETRIARKGSDSQLPIEVRPPAAAGNLSMPVGTIGAVGLVSERAAKTIQRDWDVRRGCRPPAALEGRASSSLINGQSPMKARGSPLLSGSPSHDSSTFRRTPWLRIARSDLSARNVAVS